MSKKSEIQVKHRSSVLNCAPVKVCKGYKVLLVMLSFFFAGINVQLLKAAEAVNSKETTTADTQTQESEISLVEVAPELYWQLRRYPKFYGDPHTVHGGLMERSFMLDDLDGVRDTLVDSGIYLDISATQFFQSNVSGGTNTNSTRNNGTVDYWLTLDSGKAGLWPGGALFVHAESSWQAEKSVNGDVGSLLPPNFDAAMPAPNDSRSIALPEVYLMQALPGNLGLLIGKANWAGLADDNIFANNERTQFLYTGLVNNPILGTFIPYTSLGLAGVWTPGKEHQVAVIGVQTDGNGTTSGFNNFNGNYTVGAQYKFSPTVGENLPGNYRVLAGYSSKDMTSFGIDPRQLLEQIIGVAPIEKESCNYTGLLNFDQYLWVRDGSPDEDRKGLPPVGIGIFGRAGWAPDDRNVIDQFYSFGVGGYGMVIPGRDNDRWGVGWTATHISSELRDNLDLLSINVDSLEHALEAFYNIELTPSSHLTIDAQLVDSTVKSVDTAFVLGMGLQVDF